MWAKLARRAPTRALEHKRERDRLAEPKLTLLAASVSEGWWTAGGSNSRPPRCERGALPTELAAHSVRAAPALTGENRHGNTPPRPAATRTGRWRTAAQDERSRRACTRSDTPPGDESRGFANARSRLRPRDRPVVIREPAVSALRPPESEARSRVDSQEHSRARPEPLPGRGRVQHVTSAHWSAKEQLVRPSELSSVQGVALPPCDHEILTFLCVKVV